MACASTDIIVSSVGSKIPTDFLCTPSSSLAFVWTWRGICTLCHCRSTITDFFVFLIILHILDYAENYLICSVEDWGTYSIHPLPIFDCSYNMTWVESYEYVILSPLLISIYSPPHKICTRAGRQVAPFLILYSVKITSISFEFYLFS